MSKDEDEVKPVIVGPNGVEQPAEEQQPAGGRKKPEHYRISIPLSERTSPLLPNRSDDDIVRRITPPGERGSGEGRS